MLACPGGDLLPDPSLVKHSPSKPSGGSPEEVGVWGDVNTAGERKMG